jgi:hypothetical protein
MTTFIESLSFVTISCCTECGISWALPESYQKKRKEDGINFFCPNGHSQCYRESDVLKLQKQLDRANSDRDWWKQRQEATAKERAAEELKRKKLERRIKNGVCPCCQRSFVNVKRHMATKHPSYAETHK